MANAQASITPMSVAPRSSPMSRPGHGISHILACVDRSSQSEVCLPYAVFLGKTFDCRLTLLHVMQPPVDRSGALTTDALAWEISRQEAAGYLARHERAVAATGLLVDVRLEQGHPAERIVAIAREVGADLTVLGSHGEGRVTAWNLGSTTQQVLAVSRSSVFVARSKMGPAGEAVSPKRILVPLDGSLRTESVLPSVARIAKAHGAEVILVHVVPEPVPSAILREPADLALAQELAGRMEGRAKAYLEELREKLARDVPCVRASVVRHGDERQSLLELAQREAIDLVVLSSHGSTCNPARTFGSVTEHLVRHLMVPVLVLRNLPESEIGYAPEESELAPPIRSSHPPGAI